MRTTSVGRLTWILPAILLSIFSVWEVSGAEKIAVGTIGKNQAYLPVWTAHHKGFFKEKGLEVETVVVRSQDVEAQALLSGSIQFSTMAADGVVRLAEKGADIKILASLNNAAAFSLVGRKEYKSVKDLQGTTLGVSAINSGATVLMKEILRYIKEFQFADVNVGGKWARENSGKVVAFLEAILRANRWIHENRKAAVEIAAKEIGIAVEHADRAYDYYVTNKMQPLDGAVPEKGVQKVIESLGELGELQKPYPPTSKFIDMSYLREAQKRVFGR